MKFIRRFFLHSVDAGTPSIQCQVETMADQLHNNVEVLENYGLTAVPPEEIDSGITAHVSGSSDHGVILGFFDKIFRPKNLLRGEVVLYNKWGGKIELFEHAIKFTHAQSGNSATIDMKSGSIIDISGDTINLLAPSTSAIGNFQVQTGATGSFTSSTGQVISVQSGIITLIS